MFCWKLQHTRWKKSRQNLPIRHAALQKLPAKVAAAATRYVIERELAENSFRSKYPVNLRKQLCPKITLTQWHTFYWRRFRWILQKLKFNIETVLWLRVWTHWKQLMGGECTRTPKVAKLRLTILCLLDSYDPPLVQQIQTENSLEFSA